MSDVKPPMTREERLAAQLRENLKRRKAQARALGAGQETLPESPDSAESGVSNPAS